MMNVKGELFVFFKLDGGGWKGFYYICDVGLSFKE